MLKKILPSWLLRAGRPILERSEPVPQPQVATSYLGDNDLVLQCYVSYNKYGGYCVPQSSSHRGAAQAILSGGVFEVDTIEFMIKNVGHGDIVHAGTYYG